MEKVVPKVPCSDGVRRVVGGLGPCYRVRPPQFWCTQFILLSVPVLPGSHVTIEQIPKH